jgi:hypothetical protein
MICDVSVTLCQIPTILEFDRTPFNSSKFGASSLRMKSKHHNCLKLNIILEITAER